ncbi:hypothetical protein [Leifsonia soli]|uniref:Uncharacterized protein n=1 Tax=Leifsonia soli TaxID=582665 RepID=A0A852T321_9MICO|nr:hypothetical protein [Leifsonia soli]NYD76018.1 hypothetical protein [Leifsonia soli]
MVIIVESAALGLIFGGAAAVSQAILGWLLIASLIAVGAYSLIWDLALRFPSSTRLRDALYPAIRKWVRYGTLLFAEISGAFHGMMPGGRRLLAPSKTTIAKVGGSFVAILFGGFLVMSYGGTGTVLQLGREFALLFAAVILLSCTLPVFATWCALALISDKPNVSASVKAAAEAVGIGLLIGLLCGVAGFWLNMLLFGRPLQDPSVFAFDTIVGTSLFGSMVGFGVAHFQTLLQSARLARNRLSGYSTATAVSIGIAWVTTAWASPRQIAERLLSATTAGISYPEKLVSVEGTDWRTTFLVAHDQIIATIPPTDTFLIFFAAAVVVIMGTALTVDVVAFIRNRRREAVPQLQPFDPAYQDNV